MPTLFDKYVDYLETYSQKYGPRTIVLMQVGLFHEFFGVDNGSEKIGLVKEVARILNLHETRKNTAGQNSRANYLFSGFPSAYIDKHINILLEHNYNIIIVDQPPGTVPLGSGIRRVTRIYRPGPNLGSIKYNIMSSTLQDEIRQVGIERRCRPGGELYCDAMNNFNALLHQ